MARGRKVGPRAWTPRDKGDIERCYAAAGDLEEFNRRVDAVLRGPKREDTRERPPNPFFTDFSADPYPSKGGLFIVRFTVNDDDASHPRRCICIVSPKKHWVNKLRRGKLEIVTPHEASRAIVKPLWKKLEKLGRAGVLGMTEDAASRRLADELHKVIKIATSSVAMGWFAALSEPPAYQPKTRTRAQQEPPNI
jgi:hypothetical protein